MSSTTSMNEKMYVKIFCLGKALKFTLLMSLSDSLFE